MEDCIIDLTDLLQMDATVTLWGVVGCGLVWFCLDCTRVYIATLGR